MGKYRYILFLKYFLLFFSQSGFSQSVILTASGQEEVLGRMNHLRDVDGTMDFEQVRSQRFEPLTPADRSPSYGFDRTVHWFQFELTNTSTIEDWLLEIPYAPLDQIDLYVEPDSGSVWLHKTGGDIFPIADRDLPHRHPIFNVHIGPDQTRQVYLRVQTISSVQMPVILWASEKFYQAAYRTQIVNGFFYGAMLVMALYQLFLFASIRDRTTLYYVLTLVSMANVIAFFQGYTFLFLHPSQPTLNDDFAALSGPVFVLCSALLTRSFLNVRQFSRVLDGLLVANTLLNLVAGILMVFFMRQISYKYLHLFVLTHCLIVLASAGVCLYKKYRPALYYLIAWVTLLLAAVLFTLGNLGFVPGYLGTNYLGLMIGCILQVLLISFALGERWNILVRENQAAKELELRRGQEEKERLEREVKLRTEEIRHQKEKLEDLNRVKDKLFSVVTHDIRGPLTSLKLSLALTKLGKIKQEEFREIATETEDHLDKTTNFIQNLLHWAKFQLQGESVRPAQLELCPMITETLALLEIELRQKAITVHHEVDDGIHLYADPIMIQSVFRNLLNNAIKFSPAGGSIMIKGKRATEEVMIQITDTGSGIPPSHQAKIFTLESLTTPGTDNETGTGLGLVLCKEFIEKNKGKIWFETIENKGTTFYITLPQYKSEPKLV